MVFCRVLDCAMLCYTIPCLPVLSCIPIWLGLLGGRIGSVPKVVFRNVLVLLGGDFDNAISILDSNNNNSNNNNRVSIRRTKHTQPRDTHREKAKDPKKGMSQKSNGCMTKSHTTHDDTTG